MRDSSPVEGVKQKIAIDKLVVRNGCSTTSNDDSDSNSSSDANDNYDD